MKTMLAQEFTTRFQKSPGHIFFCPGRVNLIGEHIDYNGGRVMPAAISMGTWLAVSKNHDKRLRIKCLNFSETADLHLQESYSRAGQQWFNFPLGVINELVQSDHTISGLDMLFYGNLPIGAGLSSSASIEVVTAFALNHIFGLNISLKNIVQLCKKMENEFIGVNCGIMDQFAVAFGKKDNALLLNCDSLEYEYIPVQLKEYLLAVIYTNKERKLVGSKYNDRFAECAAVLKALKKDWPVNNLCEISMEKFEKLKQLIDNPVLEKRARHVIGENERVKEAALNLKDGRLDLFGQLMYASHTSLKELYEVSGEELDTIVEFCRRFPACIGARMTGAGFGGCAIALIKKDAADDFTNTITEYYEAKTGYKPSVFYTDIGDGVSELIL